MTEPLPQENLMSLGDRILWGMQEYKATEQGSVHSPIPVESLGRPNTNPPDVVDQDNLRLLKFTLNTDSVSIKFPVPWDLVAGEDVTIKALWTNDGGVDDNGKEVKVQLDYQIGNTGESVAGSHANSPKTVSDTYASASGWIEHHTAYMTIANADFTGKTCFFIKLSFITPDGVALTCEPHLIGICLTYTAYKVKTS